MQTPRTGESLESLSNPTSSVERTTRLRFGVLLAACGLAILGYIHRVGFAQALPEIQRRFEFTNTESSYVFVSFFLAYGLFEVPWGLVGDKLGVRNLLVILVLGWSLLTGAISWVNWLPVGSTWPLVYVVALRFFFGAFQAGTFPSISRMMTDWMPIAERGTAQGWVWMSSRIGGAAAPLIVVWTMTHLGGLQAFWYLAALGLLWSILFWPWFRNRPSEMPKISRSELAKIAEGRKGNATSGHLHLPWRQASRSLSVWSICAMYGCLGFTGNFFITMLPVYLRNDRKLNSETVSYLTSLPLFCGVFSCLLGGYLSDRIIRATGNRTLGRQSVAMAGLLGAGLSLAATMAVRDPFWLGFFLCATFFANDLAMGPAWAACADIGEQFAGTLGGTMNMVGSLTAAVGAVVAGRLLDNNQSTAMIGMFAGAYLIGAFTWLGIDANRRLSES
jgi:sugar phosphate permease